MIACHFVGSMSLGRLNAVLGVPAPVACLLVDIVLATMSNIRATACLLVLHNVLHSLIKIWVIRLLGLINIEPMPRRLLHLLLVLTVLTISLSTLIISIVTRALSAFLFLWLTITLATAHVLGLVISVLTLILLGIFGIALASTSVIARLIAVLGLVLAFLAATLLLLLFLFLASLIKPPLLAQLLGYIHARLG